MKMLSLGIPSTLGNWHKLCSTFFGENTRPTKYIEEQIETAPNGKDEAVLADEKQLLFVLGNMLVNEQREQGDSK